MNSTDDLNGRTDSRGGDISESSSVGEKIGDGVLRTDLEPLSKRFTSLETLVSAEWMSGTLGRAPGLSTYWIDAVIEVDPAVAQELRAAYKPKVINTLPDVVSGVSERIPAGVWLSSEELDVALSESGFSVDAYVLQSEPIVVLVAHGS